MGAVSGEDLHARARAVHADGDYRTARRLFEQAVGAFSAEGRPADAARVARSLAYQCHLDGDHAAVNGWLGRARRFVSDSGDEAEARWLELFDALADPDPQATEQRLRMVLDAGHERGLADLVCDALGLLGEHCVRQGRVAEGMALLDEAMAAVVAGEVEEFVVVEGAFCLMLSACEATLDVVRAERWVQVADEVMSATGLTTLGPLCRGYHGGLLIAAGRYADAEQALTSSARDLARGYAHAHDGALARLADLRVRQGRLEEAATLLVGLEEHPDAALPLAQLHLAAGRTELARERVQRGLAMTAGLPALRLQALVVDAALAEGAVGEARGVVTRLEAAVSAHPSAYAAAVVAVARGRVCVASGSAAAPDCFREALSGFARAKVPLELAHARLEFAAAVSAEQREVAVAEATSALAGFEQLQAARLADAAGALLRDLGAPVRVGPKGVGALTRREAEVLDLLGHGLSNPEIAKRLVISRKTVEHHVGRILRKLGLRNRAEAAAWAVRESATR